MPETGEVQVRILDMKPFSELVVIVDRLISAAKDLIDGEDCAGTMALQDALDQFDEWREKTLRD